MTRSYYRKENAADMSSPDIVTSLFRGCIKVAFFHCISGAAFFRYFIKIKNAIVAELGKFTDFLSHEHESIVISLFHYN